MMGDDTLTITAMTSAPNHMQVNIRIRILPMSVGIKIDHNDELFVKEDDMGKPKLSVY